MPTLPSESVSPATHYLDRDLSLLAFNQRVLAWAKREDVPLVERLRYLCIASSNLDELFEVRAFLHLAAYQSQDTKGNYSVGSFEALHARAHALVAEQYDLFNHALTERFAQEGISIVAHGERDAAQRRWVRKYYEDEVRPLLVPVLLDPAHPFPQVASKSLNFIVQLGGVDAFDRKNTVAIVKVPRVLPRIIALPAKLCGKKQLFISLSSVVRAHLEDLFPGRAVGQFSQFRVTRHTDMAIDEEDVKNLRMALRQGLQHRHYGQATRIEVSASCSHELSALLLKQFELPEMALYRVPGPVNLVRFGQLADLVETPSLRFAPYTPSYTASMQQQVRGLSIFDRLKQGDALLHQPFESFDAVIEFLREAVYDPKVLAIRQTIYRAGADSAMMDLLVEAVRRGKEVLAVVELKARFDEEANINWAERLEAIGAQVVYGVVGLKTHAKMLLVTRKEGKQLRRYGHLSTGNYNPRTARLYTDISYFTQDAQLTSDMEQLFVHLASQNHVPKVQKLWIAPFYLHREVISRIDALTAKAAKGKSTRLIAKMNSLTDEPIMDALVRAGRAGVQIDLIVRGACMLPAQVPGLTDNIRVRSIIGRFLEHSRVFYFRSGNDEELYLSSADWMNRNMLRRIELAWPVTDPVLRQRIIEECLGAYLHDQMDAWEMRPDGNYEAIHLPEIGHSAQEALMQRYGQKS
ncbi:polyphosphate kinase 1 [Variovorax sp. PCZ-1]|uniref:polyphosphate kinase 1 n=1 Tax=Variovorax sp. PCZ-1 TaxID=2835533 RepID=UPI001BCDE326|nr:polyphosphate kinase 1 [Variovorax sp. PCZ-1]MBS7806690.1 polyphosphate kinase 1 [Variovorax sp. PCZ-1]